MRTFLHVGRYALLIGVTIAAGIGMLLLSMKSIGQRTASIAVSTQPAPAIVAVERVEAEEIEIYDVYSGLIEPRETFELAFEIGGRLESIGDEASGYDLDVGDRVRAGQVLARLDTVVLQARQREAEARVKLAESNFKRARQLRERNDSAISAEEYERRVNELAIAKASLDIARKSLDDAVLKAPASGVISQRYELPGETVNPHETIFEMVQVDRVVLALHVPETRVRELQRRLREVQQYRRDYPAADSDCRDCRLKAYVEMVGRNRFGEPWPALVGEVHEIGETAAASGLFRVEVLLDNEKGTIRPGNVARARVVTTILDRAYRVPASSILFREGSAFLLATRETNAGESRDSQPKRARLVKLENWVRQGEHIVLPDLPDGVNEIVVRGQRRLVDGQPLEIVQGDGLPTGAFTKSPELRLSAVEAEVE